LIATALAGCATSVEPPAPPAPAPIIIPTVPPDVLACVKGPSDVPDSALDACQVEKLWKTYRASLAKVNACLHRVVCQYQEVTKEFGNADGVSCDKPKTKKKHWWNRLRRS